MKTNLDTPLPWNGRIAIGLGGIAASAHATSEQALLRFLGIDVNWADYFVQLVLLLCVGLAGGAFIGLFAGRRSDAFSISLSGMERLIYAAYFGTFGWIIWARTGGLQLAVALTLGLAASLCLTFAVSRPSSGYSGVIARFAAISFALCSIQLAAVSAADLSPNRILLFWGALAILSVLAIAAATLPFGLLRRRWIPAIGLWLLVGIAFPALVGKAFWLVHRSAAPPLLQADNAGKPNFLLIVLDAVRADHLDLFGYERETMPLLTAFARSEAQLAVRSKAVSPSSLPSHGSMLTGLYPHAHGGHLPFIRDQHPPSYAYPVRDDISNLPSFLSDQGYQTAEIVANYGVLSSYGLTRGFEYVDARPGPRFLFRAYSWLHGFAIFQRPAGNLVEEIAPRFLLRRARCLNPSEPPYRRGAEIQTAVRQWLDSRDAAAPFFLMVNLFDAHDPYLPLPEFDQKFETTPNIDWVGFPNRDPQDALEGRLLPAEEVAFLMGQYDAELLGIDVALNELIQDLKGRGLFSNTFIVITADHGEAFQEHGTMQHSYSLEEEKLSVPLIIKGSENVTPPNSAPTMQFVDLFPTFAEALGSKPPDGLQGTPWGRGREYSFAEVFCVYCKSIYSDAYDKLEKEEAVIYLGQDKLLLTTAGEDQYFDLALDPGERMGRRLPETKTQLRDLAAKLIEQREKDTYLPSEVGVEDSDLLKKLRSLGYVQ